MAYEDIPTPIGIPGAENVYHLAEDLDPAVLYARREYLRGLSNTNKNQYETAWNDIELAINNPDRHLWQADSAFESMRAMAADPNCPDNLTLQVVLSCLNQPAVNARIQRSPVDLNVISGIYRQACVNSLEVVESDFEAREKSGALSELLVYMGLLRSGRVMPQVASPREEASAFPRANHDQYVIGQKYPYNKRAFSVRSTPNVTSSKTPLPPVTTIYTRPIVSEIMQGTQKEKNIADQYGKDTPEYHYELKNWLVRYMYYEQHAAGNPHPLHRKIARTFSSLVLQRAGIGKKDVLL